MRKEKRVFWKMGRSLPGECGSEVTGAVDICHRRTVSPAFSFGTVRLAHSSLPGSGCLTAACCNLKNKHFPSLPDACSTLGGGPGLNPPSCAREWGWGRRGGLIYPLPTPSGPRGPPHLPAAPPPSPGAA